MRRPDIPAKKEYHRRVSPMVLRGGRPRLIHSKPINPAKTIDAVAAETIASLRLLNSASSEAAREAPIDATAKYMNTFLKSPATYQSGVSFCIPMLTIYNYTFTLLNVNKCQQ